MFVQRLRHVVTLAAGALLVLSTLGAGLALTPDPAAATTGTLYAYPAGTGSPTGCPQSSDPLMECGLTGALHQVTAGGVVVLAQEGTEGTASTYYVGNFGLATAGTSAADPVTIESSSAGTAILDGNGGNATNCPTASCDGSVLTIAAGVFADISGVTIQDADNTATGNGGGIDNDGTLTVTGSTFSGDTAAADGGAIDSADGTTATLTVTDSTFSGDSVANGGDGGAIDSGDDGGTGTLTVTSSTLSGDSGYDGGAIDSSDEGGSGTATVTSSTFTADNAANGGGAIGSGEFGGSGNLTVTSSTFDGNSAANIGGAIDNGGSGTVTLAADILAGATKGAECSGTMTDDGYNVDDDGSCRFSATGSVIDSPAIDGYLGALGYYGGPTETVPLLETSTAPGKGADPAIGAIPAGATVPSSSTRICSRPDERGVVRATPCDMGAFELLAYAYAYPAGTGAATPGCLQSADTADQCSLTAALAQVAPGEVVVLAEQGTEGTASSYYVGNFDLSTSGTSAADPVTIESSSAGTAILDGNGGNATDCPTTTCDGAVLTIATGVFAAISGVTIQDADNTATGNGGGIDNDGTLTVTGSTFSGDTAAQDGGAIDSADGTTATLTVSASTFSGDRAVTEDGGAIDSGDFGGTGTLTVTSSAFSGDTASGYDGGAIDSADDSGTDTATVASSTFSDDSAANDGGAIDSADFGSTASATVTSSTFSHDSAANDGGAIESADFGGTGSATVTSSTFDGNSASNVGGAIGNGGSGTVSLAADTLAGATSGGECSGTMTDDGYNVDDDGSCGFSATGSVSDSPAINGYLGTLGNYGGPTETVPLLRSSTVPGNGSDPAVGSVPAGATVPGSSTTICSLADERGVVRATPCDMGAFELLADAYAYPAGTGAPAGCPQSSNSANQCSLTEALAEVAPGEIVVLAQQGTEGTASTYYVGNFDLATAGTSAADPVTIGSSSAGTAILDGNGGSATDCPTTNCDGAVLTIATGVFADISGVTIQDADNTATGDGGGIDNAGTLTVTASTFSGDTAATNGGAIDSADGTTATLTVTGSTFSGDIASGNDGGAIDSADDHGTGTLIVTASTFSGDTTNGYDGGAIDSGDEGGSGTATVTSSTFAGDSASFGGAIGNGNYSGSGTLTVTASTFAGDSASFGGAIASGGSGTGTVNITSSTFSTDSASGDGGAIDSGDDGGTGTLTVTSSTFAGDSSYDGGAIDSADEGGSGTATVTSSTFTANNAANGGGAIGSGEFGGFGNLTVTSSTFDGNSASNVGGAIDNGGSGTVTLAADILAGATKGAACSGTMTDDGYNVDDDGSCGLTATGSVSDSHAIDGYLGILGNYGGQTETVPLLETSTAPGKAADPAFGAVPEGATVPGSSATICSLADERGVQRSAPCDMGAFELLASTTEITSVSPHPVVGKPITVTVTVTGPSSGAGATTPFGEVSVSDGSKLCVAVLTGTAGTAEGSCRLTEETAGSHSFTASYGGDGDFSSSASAPSTVMVAPAATTTKLTLSAQSVTYGDEGAEHLSVAVTPASGLSPTGTVVVKAGSKTLCVIRLSAGKGTCTLTAAELAAGTYHLVAAYAGSSADGASSSAAVDLVVNKEPTTTTLSLSATTVTFGTEQLEHLSVSVRGEFPGATSGTVTIAASGKQLCKITLSAGKGTCTLTARQLAAGTYKLVATYEAGADYAASSSKTATLTVKPA